MGIHRTRIATTFQRLEPQRTEMIAGLPAPENPRLRCSSCRTTESRSTRTCDRFDFANSLVTGFDYHPASIERARAAAVGGA